MPRPGTRKTRISRHVVYPSGTPECGFGLSPHPAERNDQGQLFVYALHDGAWKYACAEHSGMCHEKCWSEEHYPGLRPRIASSQADNEQGSGLRVWGGGKSLVTDIERTISDLTGLQESIAREYHLWKALGKS